MILSKETKSEKRRSTYRPFDSIKSDNGSTIAAIRHGLIHVFSSPINVQSYPLIDFSRGFPLRPERGTTPPLEGFLHGGEVGEGQRSFERREFIKTLAGTGILRVVSSARVATREIARG